MAKNEFLPFGTAANANVLSNADYQVLPARNSGFQSGVAKSKELNTAWRQGSVMASVLGQFIADNSGKDVLDNGDTATLLANLTAALITASAKQARIQSFTANGVFTVPDGVTSIYVSGCAGGGGGGSSLTINAGSVSSGAGGGGAGQWIRKQKYAVTSGQVIQITIGVGGTGGTAGGANGEKGGNTVVGSLVTLSGGGGGILGASAVTPEVTKNSAGGAGFPGGEFSSTTNQYGGGRGGAGGGNPFGQGGFPSPGTNGGASGGGGNAMNYTGAGGGGAGGSFGTSASAGAKGGNGGSGFAIIEW